VGGDTQRRINICPSDPLDTAEMYVLESLPLFERQQFEEHIKQCSACHRQVQDAREFIADFRDAWEQLKKRERPS
jgi:anti-sigma factor RsiW